MTTVDQKQLEKVLRKIVREEVEAEIQNAKASLERVIEENNTNDSLAFYEMVDTLKNQGIEIRRMAKDISDIGNELKKVAKDVVDVKNLANGIDRNISGRLHKVETKLHLTPLQQ